MVTKKKVYFTKISHVTISSCCQIKKKLSLTFKSVEDRERALKQAERFLRLPVLAPILYDCRYKFCWSILFICQWFIHIQTT